MEASADVPHVVPPAKTELAVERAVRLASHLSRAPEHQRPTPLVLTVHHAGSPLRQGEQMDLIHGLFARIPAIGLQSENGMKMQLTWIGGIPAQRS